MHDTIDEEFVVKSVKRKNGKIPVGRTGVPDCTFEKSILSRSLSSRPQKHQGFVRGYHMHN